MRRRSLGRLVPYALVALVAGSLPLMVAASAVSAAPDPSTCPIADEETATECRVSTADTVPGGTYAFHKTLHVLDGGRIEGPPGAAALKLHIDGASGGAGDLLVDTGGSILTDDDDPATSAAPLHITTSGSVFMQAGSHLSARKISADDEADGGGGAIRIDANGDKVVLCGSAANVELDAACSTSASTGATITADKNGDGVGDAGAITIDVGSPQGSPPVGVLAMGAGSVVRANGRNAAGDIAISAGHSADIAGQVLSQVPSGATGVEAGREGASISIKTGCGLTIAPTGVVSSLGRGHGADLVHLESCEVAINGRVESTGGGHVAPSAPANRCAGTFRPDKHASATGCVEVWAKRIRIGDSGEVKADVSASDTGGPAGRSWVDLFAQDEITIEGATAPGGVFAVHADSYKASDDTTNTVTAKVLNGTFSAGGRALSAKNAANGAGGGSVIVEAAGDIEAAGAEVRAAGDLDASPVDDGGDIALRSAAGSLTWTDGTGDVRPTTTGTISLASCVAPVTTGTNFNGATPAVVTDCTLAPSLPAYAQSADGFLDRHCDGDDGGGEIDAPPLDPSVPTTTYAATQFLYSGESPVQVGVEPGTIEPLRAAVVRGRALRAVDAVAGTNEPLEGVAVSFLGHPELGSTRTRADGSYDLAANGGGRMTLVFEADGYFSLQRGVDVAWQEMEVLDDVVLTGRDALATSVTFSPESPLQAHTSSTTNDERGLRRSTLLIPPGTTATMALPDGTTQALAVGTVRATEYTVGPSGPQAMPAELPPTSGYTYAAELSVDEAQAAGATTVIFSRPVFNYVENFIGFPVGSHVPSGSYDAAKAQWIPSPDGRVVAIVGVNAGLAAIDTTGDGVADDAAALGFTDAERAELATRYPVGQTLWRVPLGHFSSVDHNWPRPGPPAGASGPGMDEPRDTKASDRNCLEDGSVIACESQVLGEDVAVVGAPFGLHYRSSRSPGRLPGLRIPLTGASPPAPLKRVELIVSVAGTTTRKSFAPGANLVDDFTWDGRDAYGRLMTGAQPYAVRLDYVYDGVYYAPRTDLAASFATTSGVPMATTSPGPEVRLGQTFTGVLGGLDARGVGLGGWTPSVHHTYDLAARTIYLGSGAQRSAAGLGAGVVNTVPGAYGEAARGLAVAPDGTIYFTVEHSVRRLATDGTMTRYAGGGSLYDYGFSGDGGPAVAARFFSPQGLALAPDGSLYVADSGNYRVRRIGPDGIITTVAGNGVRGTAGHGVPAVEASFRDPQGVALAPDGSLYIADAGSAVRRVGPDGIVTTVAAGIGHYAVRPSGAIAIGPDGSVFVAYGDNRVWRLDPSGTLTPFAGNGTSHSGPVQDGRLATEVSIAGVNSLGVGPDGSVYFGDTGEVVSGGSARRVRRVLGDGRITTVAGGGLCGGFVESVPAHGACIGWPSGIAFDPAGNMLIGRVAGYHFSFRLLLRVTPASPGLAVEDTIIPSADGAEAYVFGGLGGRHLRTVDAFTGVVRYRFAYDPAGRLASVTDVDGNVTTFEHDALGNPTAIVAPFGQRTTLTTDANGYLASIANPAGESIGLTSSPSGLLESFTDPRGNVSRFTYDSNGLLLKDEDAVGGSTTLARSLTPTGHVVTATTAEGRVTRYETERLVTGVVRSSVTDPAGSVASLLARTDGTFRATLRDGAVLEGANGPDPRFGMQAPVETQLTTTLPSGMRKTVSRSVTTTLANPTDPFSLTTFTSRTTRNAKTATDTYDAATRRMTTTTPAGRARSVTFDATGKPVRVETPGVEPVAYAYDARGRPTSATQGSGTLARTTTYAYGLDGFLASVTDPEGRTTSYTRDAAGRVRTTTLPGGRVVSAAYDPSGNVSAITPPGRTAHTFTHTPVDQVATMTPPLVGTSPDVTTYAYNLDGDPSATNAPGSELTTYSYDAAGRLVSRVDPTATTTYGYDAAGRLAMISGPHQSIATSYDASLLRETTASGTSPATVSRTYDADLRLAPRRIDALAATSFSYDPDGLLTGAGPLGLTYLPATGQLSATTLGSTTTTWTYDSFGAPATQNSVFSGGDLMASTYTRDRLGRITTRTETIAAETHAFAYAYDPAGRLAEVRRDGALVESYTYDQNGNRMSGPGVTSASYDAQDRMTAYGDTTYAYSPAGRLMSATRAGATTTYAYDPSGNLTSVTLPDATAVTYQFDPRGRRIARAVNGVSTGGLIYAEDLAPIAATDATGAITSTFTYGTRGNVPDVMVKDGVTYRIVSDHLGSVRLVVNASTGAIVQRMDYDAYGVVITDTNPGFQPFGFAGGLYEPATGLVRFGARDYDARSGRWTAKDPSGFAGGDANLYAYVAGDPVNRIDPSGLFCIGNVCSEDVTDFYKEVGGDLYDSWSEGVLCRALSTVTTRAFVAQVAAAVLAAPVVVGVCVYTGGIGCAAAVVAAHAATSAIAYAASTPSDDRSWTGYRDYATDLRNRYTWG